LISDFLKQLDLGIPIISEESYDPSNSVKLTPYCFIVDPLDGSANFSRGLPHCYSAICLLHNGYPVYSLIVDFSSSQYYISSSEPATDLEITSQCGLPLDSLFLSTGIPLALRQSYSPDVLIKQLAYLSHFKKVRMIGSAIGSVLLTAHSSIDVYFEKSIFIWDVASALCYLRSIQGSFLIKQSHNKNLTYDVLAVRPSLNIYDVLQRLETVDQSLCSWKPLFPF
jgi:myo-inositol-1(or 4)-monophosphatase